MKCEPKLRITSNSVTNYNKAVTKEVYLHLRIGMELTSHKLIKSQR